MPVVQNNLNVLDMTLQRVIGVFSGPDSFGNGLVDQIDDYFSQISDADAIDDDKCLSEVQCLGVICAGSTTVQQKPTSDNDDSDLQATGDKSVTYKFDSGVHDERGRGTRGHAGRGCQCGGRARGQSVRGRATESQDSSESDIEPDPGISTRSGLRDTSTSTTVRQEPTADNDDSDMQATGDKSVTGRLGRGLRGGRGRGTQGQAGQSGRGGKTTSVCQPALQWSTMPKKVQPFPFKNTPGITKRMGSDAIELDYFRLFWSDEMIEMIVVETNRYADEILAQVPDDKPHARIRSWKEVESDTIWRMIALTIAMGITR